MKSEKDKEERRAAKKEAQKKFNGVPGDIFVFSWGYDQTNVSCYQMIRRVSVTKIECIQIGVTTMTGTGPLDMSDSVKPCPEVIIEAWGKRNCSIMGENTIKIDGRHIAEKWDGKRSFYRSWYG